MSNNKNKPRLKNNKSEIKNNKDISNNISQVFKNQFKLNSVRIKDMEYIESFLRNNNPKIIQEYQKLNKSDKKAYQQFIEEKSNLFGKKNIEQIDDNEYQKLINNKKTFEYYEDEIYYYPKKRNVVQIDDKVYNRLLNGKYCLNESEIEDNQNKSLMKNPKLQKNSEIKKKKFK